MIVILILIVMILMVSAPPRHARGRAAYARRCARARCTHAAWFGCGLPRRATARAALRFVSPHVLRRIPPIAAAPALRLRARGAACCGLLVATQRAARGAALPPLPYLHTGFTRLRDTAHATARRMPCRAAPAGTCRHFFWLRLPLLFAAYGRSCA